MSLHFSAPCCCQNELASITDVKVCFGAPSYSEDFVPTGLLQVLTLLVEISRTFSLIALLVVVDSALGCDDNGFAGY